MFLAGLFIILCTLHSSAGAQVVGATVSGKLEDSSGGVIVGAKVTLTNISQGVARSLATNRSGEYSAPNLVPGPYEIHVEANGFRTELRKGVSLSVGEQSTINFTLQVASADQTVVVEDTGSSVELGNSAISTVVEGSTIRELPLNGRDWTQIATLQPGTASVRSQPAAGNPSSRGNRGFGQQLTIAGSRPQLNSYRLDGINVNDYANSTPGSTAGLTLGADAIGEFSIISSNYSASYGLSAGAVINAITRAGTNQIHGSVYEFVRNNVFDSRNYFDQSKLPLHRNQFGATAGGPIVKNRTFLFGNYEGFRNVSSSTSVANVPTVQARTGALVTAAPVTVDASIKPYLPLWALPNGIITGDTGQYVFPAKQVTPENFFTVRGDQIFSAKDSLYVTYLWDKGSTVQPDVVNVNQQQSTTKRQMLSISENHVFSNSFYNSFRMGANYETASSLVKIPGANPLGSDASLGPAPGLSAPLISVTSLTGFTGGVIGGSSVHYGFSTPQFTDDAFLIKGKHSLKFGFLYQRIYSNMTFSNYNYGNFSFTSLPNFLTNKPSTGTVTTTNPVPINLRQNVFGAYGEDTWRVTRNLNVTVGLRYEPASVLTAENGRLANIRDLTSTTQFLGDPLFQNPTRKNFSPRVGFSYSPDFSHGKTNISGGYGIFDVLPLTWEFNLQLGQQAPYQINLSSSTLPSGSANPFPTTAWNYIRNGAGTAKPTVAYIQYNPPRNYMQQYNLALQQELPAKMSFKVGYVGSHGVHQGLTTSDANVPQPVVNTPGSLVFPCGTATVVNISCLASSNATKKPNQAFGTIYGSGWFSDSSYSGLLVELKQRIGKSLQWQGSFTWQKSVDGSSSITSGTPYSNSVNGFLFHQLRGVSDFNIPLVFVANAVWTSPDLIKSHNFASYLVNGWQIGGIYQISSGSPFTVVIGGDTLGLGNSSPLDFPDRVTGTGCSGGNPVNKGNWAKYINQSCFAVPVNTTGIAGTRFGNEQRNSVSGPSFNELDFSLVKNFALTRIREGSAFQFRAEAFNLPNHPNLAPPLSNNSLTLSGSAFTTASSFGQITSTAGSSRQLQLAAKLLF
nr:TonB-dependent receptor [Terriglobus saanensis]